MKFLHVADLHLGKRLNEVSLRDDQQYILKQISDLAEQHGVQAVLIAGDIYDRAVPSEEAVTLLDDFLTDLSGRGITAIAISGNHDSDDRLAYGSSLFRQSRVYITGRYEGRMECVTLEDGHGPVHFWMLPFVKASLVGHYHPEVETGNYDQAVRVALSDAALNLNERNVLLAHQFVTGHTAGTEPEHDTGTAAQPGIGAGTEDTTDTDPELAGSEVSYLSVGNVDRIRSDAFDAFDYVALGHIHRPQAVGRAQVRYSGSPLKYSLGEAGQDKSAVLVEMGEKGDVQVTCLPLHPLRDLRRITGTLSEVLDPAGVTDPEDYVHVVLKDEYWQRDAMSRIRTVYPNVLKLDYDNELTHRLESGERDVSTQAMTFDELMESFFRRQLGRGPYEEEMKILRAAAEEAGVLCDQ